MDPSWPKFNPPPSFYDQRRMYNGRPVNVSYVYAEYPNGTKVVLTDRYTDTGTLIVRVIYASGELARNVSVKIYSHNLYEEGLLIRGLNCVTNSEGICQVQLGGGNYTLKVAIVNGLTAYFGEVKAKLLEGDSNSITITLRRYIIPDLTAIQVVFDVNVFFDR